MDFGDDPARDPASTSAAARAVSRSATARCSWTSTRTFASSSSQALVADHRNVVVVSDDDGRSTGSAAPRARTSRLPGDVPGRAGGAARDQLSLPSAILAAAHVVVAPESTGSRRSCVLAQRTVVGLEPVSFWRCENRRAGEPWRRSSSADRRRHRPDGGARALRAQRGPLSRRRSRSWHPTWWAAPASSSVPRCATSCVAAPGRSRRRRAVVHLPPMQPPIELGPVDWRCATIAAGASATWCRVGRRESPDVPPEARAGEPSACIGPPPGLRPDGRLFVLRLIGASACANGTCSARARVARAS
jgi:hypothetical protein